MARYVAELISNREANNTIGYSEIIDTLAFPTRRVIAVAPSYSIRLLLEKLNTATDEAVLL